MSMYIYGVGNGTVVLYEDPLEIMVDYTELYSI